MRAEKFNRYLADFKSKRYDDFEEFFAYAKTVVFRTAYSYLKTQEGAEDVFSEVMIKILRYDGAPVDHPKTWLITLTKRTALDCLRKQSRLVGEEHLQNTPALGGEGDLSFMQEALLPIEYDIVVALVYVGCTQGEVARMLGISARQVRRHYASAKRKLHEWYR